MLVVWIESVLFGLAYAVDGANIGVFDSHRCFRRLKVHACEEKYIERRKKSRTWVFCRARYYGRNVRSYYVRHRNGCRERGE